MSNPFNLDDPPVPSTLPPARNYGSQIAHNLDGSHCDCLNRVLQGTPNAIELAKCMQECGWDTSQQLAALMEQQRQATIAKAKFFPNMP
jgi:hypothetical protein